MDCGWQFMASDLKSINTTGYEKGAPMGGTLTDSTADDSSPAFMIFATRDPRGANLDRVQLIKGWVDESGNTHERGFDVVWSEDQQQVEGKLTRMPDNLTNGRERH